MQTTTTPKTGPEATTNLLRDSRAKNYAQGMIPRFGRERTALMLARYAGTSVAAARNAIRYW
jgi:hypothetical protein